MSEDKVVKWFSAESEVSAEDKDRVLGTDRIIRKVYFFSIVFEHLIKLLYHTCTPPVKLNF